MIDDLPDAPAASETASPAAATPEVDSATAALEVYRAEAAKNAGTSVDTTPDASAVVPPAAEPGKVEAPPDPVDGKIEKLFARVSSMESERAAEKSAHDALVRENAELRALYDNFHKDPDALFTKVGWSQETIRDYILSGGKAPSVALTASEQKYEAKLKELEAKLAEIPASLEAERAELVKASIPAAINEATTPHLSAFFEDPAAAAEHVWGLIEHARRVQKVRLTPEEAAAAVERQLVKQAERLSRVSKPKTPGGSAVAAPVTKLPTPKPNSANTTTATSAPYNPDEHTDAENLAHAEEIMRAAATK